MWYVTVNGTRVDNIDADTFMEAELIARIKYGVQATLTIKPISYVEATADDEALMYDALAEV
jgi:hypothetical protein